MYETTVKYTYGSIPSAGFSRSRQSSWHKNLSNPKILINQSWKKRFYQFVFDEFFLSSSLIKGSVKILFSQFSLADCLFSMSFGESLVISYWRILVKMICWENNHGFIHYPEYHFDNPKVCRGDIPTSLATFFIHYITCIYISYI